MKKIICLLTCLFCLGSLSANNNNLMFLKLIPIFPDRDSLKEVAKEYNLKLEKYENNEFEFSSDSLKNEYFEITSVSYKYSENTTTMLEITCSKKAAYSLLKPYLCEEENRLIDIQNYNDDIDNFVSFVFYNFNTTILTILHLPITDTKLSENVDILISYSISNNKEKE